MLYPKAKHRLLPENKTQNKIVPSQVIYHTAVDAKGETDLYGYFAQKSVPVESTFFIQMDGDVIQYMSTTVTAHANLNANSRAISIETEDDGRPDITPWTKAQVNSLIDLTVWCIKKHPAILPRRCPSPTASGIGWHSMWGSPSEWTPVKGKTCPGKPRIEQIPTILRAVALELRTPLKPPVGILDMKLTDKITIPAEYHSNNSDEPKQITVADYLRRTYEWSYLAAHGKDPEN